MKTTYNMQKIKKIVDNICNLTNISICVSDNKYNMLYRCEKGDASYCHAIQKNEIGKEKCYHSDIEMYKKCEISKSAVSGICHAGVLDTAVPILKNGKIVGFIMFGRIRCKENTEYIDGLLDWADDAKEIKKHYKKLTYFNEEQLSALISLLSYVLIENAIEIDRDDLVARVTDYIDENLSGELSVDGLCSKFFVSKNVLYKIFRDNYNCTVNEYITAKRIERAKELLCNNKSVVSVSLEVGLGNYTYFSKLFKKHTGLSPLNYRKNIL